MIPTVARIVPVAPTATQVTAVAQDTPCSALVFPVGAVVHCVSPLSKLAVARPDVLTATQVETAQDTPVKFLTHVCFLVQVIPAFAVVAIVPVTVLPAMTATQVITVAQDTPLSS